MTLILYGSWELCFNVHLGSGRLYVRRTALHVLLLNLVLLQRGVVGVTQQQVEIAQKAWADSVVEIGSLYAARMKLGDKYKDRAQSFIDELYDFEAGKVLFKPTRIDEADVPQAHAFRMTRAAALSYMVGGNREYPEDKGFVLESWKAVRFENVAVVLKNDSALAMGTYYFTDSTGKDTRAEYSFGYVLDGSGRLRINLHHSSLSKTCRSGSVSEQRYLTRLMLKVILVIGICFLIATLIAMTQLNVRANISLLARWILAVRLLERTLSRYLRRCRGRKDVDSSSGSMLPSHGTSSGKIV